MSDSLRVLNALKLLNEATGEDIHTADLMISGAQAQATLAVAEELRALRESLPGALLEALGDDSHLDKIARRLQDVAQEIGHVAGTR